MNRPDRLTSGPSAARNARTLVLSLALSALSACTSHTAFQSSFPLSTDDDLRSVLTRLRARPRGPQLPVVVGVVQKPLGVFAFDLRERRLLFSQAAEVDGVPRAVGRYVAVPEGPVVRLRRLLDGGVEHELTTDGMHLVGADGDDNVAALVLSTGGSYGARSRLVILRGSQVTANLTVEHALGAPAVLGGMVFVPHNRVHLSALSAEGEELARVRVRDDVASVALTDGRDIFFGLAGLYHLDENTPGGVEGGAHYFAPDVERRRALPGAPDFLHDTTRAPAPVESAVHRVALSFWPVFARAPEGSPRQARRDQVALANDALYLSFYRELFSLTADAHGAHWVRATPSDIVGLQGTASGVVVVEERGTVSGFTSEGGVAFEVPLTVSPVVATVRAEGLELQGSSEPSPSLVTQLSATAVHEDNRLVPAGELAVRLLGELPGEEASAAIIELCSSRDVNQRIRDTACERLGDRKEGGDAVLSALAKRHDYLKNERAAPLTPLAKAAPTAQLQRAAPLLAAHLEDPATDAEDLPALAAALRQLGDASIVPAVTRFLRLYHADAAESSLSQALALCAQLLAELAPETSAPVLEAIAGDALADPSVREAARKALANLAPPPVPEDEETSSAAEPTSQSDQPPDHLAPDHLESALVPVRARISDCVRNDPAHPASVRLTVVVASNGRIASVHTLPESLLGCVEPIVRTVTLPAATDGAGATLRVRVGR